MGLPRSSLATGGASSAVIFPISQIGGDVVITGSGSCDLTGAALIGGGVQDGYINSSLGLAVGGPSAPWIAGGFITVPQGYAGGPLSGSTTFIGQTYASLGLTAGSIYTYRIANDSMTLRVVPEPGMLMLLGLGLGLAGLGLSGRRRAV